MIRSSSLCAWAVSGFTSCALAGIVPNIQVRTISAGQNGTTVADSAPGFGSWSGNVSYDIGFGGGAASQTSDITASRISASSSIQAADGNAGYYGRARSEFTCEFDVVSPQDYTLTGHWSVDFRQNPFAINPEALMKFERVSPSADVLHRSEFSVNWATFQFTDSGSMSLSGVLQPGHYRLSTAIAQYIYANPGFAAGGGRFDLDLQVIPSPGSAILVLGGFAAGGFTATRRRR